MTCVGMIGLGLLGSAIAERLLQSGHQVSGFDLNPERREFLASLHGEPVDSAAAVAAGCRVLILSLPDSQIVAEVMEGLHEQLSGHLIIDTTTGSPSASERIGAALQRQNVEYLDATIVGSSAQAREGNIVVLAGGTGQGFAAARPIMQCFSTTQFHTGAAGTGSTAKLIVNLVLGLNRAALAEALNLARQCSLDLDRMLEILRSGAAYSRVMDVKGEKMVRRDFAPQARLDQHWKDVRLILDLAEQTHTAVPLSCLHSTLLETASQLGFGQLDNSAILLALEAANE